MLENLGKTFQVKTSYHRHSLEEHETDWRTRPSAYKFYTYAPVVSLPDPDVANEPQDSLWRCIARRRSVRSYSSAEISLLELSRLLWASSGVTAIYTGAHGQEFLRAAPSAGALYPIETYVVANRVEGLAPGLYHYRVTGLDILERPIAEGSHSLEQLKTADLSDAIAQAALDQRMCARAAAVFVWTAVFGRSTWKYRDRAYRYIYLDAGHIAAHLTLAASALGLGCCPIAAFYDDEVNALLDVDGESEGAIYMASVGRPARPFAEAGRVDWRHTGRPKE